MRLEQILFSQGFGTRYECRALICSGQVKVAQVVKTDPDENIETQELEFEVKGQLWRHNAEKNHQAGEEEGGEDFFSLLGDGQHPKLV